MNWSLTGNSPQVPDVRRQPPQSPHRQMYMLSVPDQPDKSSCILGSLRLVIADSLWFACIPLRWGISVIRQVVSLYIDVDEDDSIIGTMVRAFFHRSFSLVPLSILIISIPEFRIISMVDKGKWRVDYGALPSTQKNEHQQVSARVRHLGVNRLSPVLVLLATKKETGLDEKGKYLEALVGVLPSLSSLRPSGQALNPRMRGRKTTNPT